MKRAGFTMIELIFVIVILGILSAVALPKFIGVSDQATVGKAKAYIGTLNRTVAPALWSDSLSQGDNGDVKTGGGALGAGVLASDMNLQIDVPDIGDTSTTKLASFALSACGTVANGNTVAGIAVGSADTTGLTSGDTFVVGGTTYGVRCSNGSTSAAPRFWLVDETHSNNIIAK